MGINLDKEPKISNDLIKELDIDNILIRFFLNDIDKIDEYISFIKNFKNKNILINIIQSPKHIKNKELLKKDIKIVFEKFSPYSLEFQIANAINRSKWGFYSNAEYISFYQIIEDIRNKYFKNIKLIGPSVIDFEFYHIIHILFNFKNIYFDKLNSLLYVDRRGAPENKQYGFFNLYNKIKLLYILSLLSNKTKDEILITETNWPIKNTKPYAPTSEFECVSEESYANYLVRYYLISLATNLVQKVYWHQLIAPGYGLIDNRKGIRKRKAYYAFATLVKTFKNTSFENFYEKDDIFYLNVKKENVKILALWSLKNINKSFKENCKIINIIGEEIKSKDIIINEEVKYIINDK